MDKSCNKMYFVPCLPPLKSVDAHLSDYFLPFSREFSDDGLSKLVVQASRLAELRICVKGGGGGNGLEADRADASYVRS